VGVSTDHFKALAAWEKDLDHAKAKEILYGRFTVDVTAG
jgi:hypothetical protein